jgi:hypothetical protein
MQLMGREERVFSIHHERLVAVYIYGRTNVMESHGGAVKIKHRSRGLCKVEFVILGASIKVWTIYREAYM